MHKEKKKHEIENEDVIEKGTQGQTLKKGRLSEVKGHNTALHKNT